MNSPNASPHDQWAEVGLIEYVPPRQRQLGIQAPDFTECSYSRPRHTQAPALTLDAIEFMDSIGE
jgi:hypothetical protein